MERYTRRMATPYYRGSSELGRLRNVAIFAFVGGSMFGATLILALIDAGVI